MTGSGIAGQEGLLEDHGHVNHDDEAAEGGEGKDKGEKEEEGKDEREKEEKVGVG
jgi:hypothetical protein